MKIQPSGAFLDAALATCEAAHECADCYAHKMCQMHERILLDLVRIEVERGRDFPGMLVHAAAMSTISKIWIRLVGQWVGPVKE